MGETKETHIVEIPVEQQEKRSVIENHPLSEISGSPGHLLLLKLWQREEELLGKRTGAKETRMDSAKREVFQLSCFFVLFHAVFLTMVFSASGGDRCGKWWVPGLLSGWTSAVLAGLAHVRVVRFWKAGRAVQRERSDGRALTRLVQELRMKGSSFDLSKDPSLGKKRMKSSSVQIKWRPVDFCSRYLVTVCLVSFAALLVPASKLILCTL